MLSGVIRVVCGLAAFAAALFAMSSPAAAQGGGPEPCESGMAGPYPCQNVDLESFVPLPFLGGATGNDLWGWTDPQTGREYALMGTSHSTGFVDVTDPQNPEIVGRLPTRGIPDFILWREIDVDDNHAFIVSEITASGLQVFDLTRLRDGTPTTVYDSDATYDEFNFAHTVAVNPETDFAYINGSNTCPEDEGEDQESGGLHMVDISDPLNPSFAGCAIVPPDGDPDTPPHNYVHDVHCVIYRGPDADYQGREICISSNEEVVVIWDVTDKDNPRLISETTYPTASYIHQGWLTEDHKYFLINDELDELDGEVERTTTYIMSVSDLDDPPEPKPFTHQTTAIDHNLFIKGNCVYESNYSAGLRILEFDDASLSAGQLREIAFFDVFPPGDPTEFVGTWNNYPFFESGTVIVSVIENTASGLFVLRPRLAEGQCAEPPPGEPPPDGAPGTGPGAGPSPGEQCANAIEGNRRANKLIGTPASDAISGRRGDDRIKGHDGGDCLRGGRGKDDISGGKGNDLIHVAAGGRDEVRCGPGEDVVKAGRKDRTRGCETS
jgi:choice-of-anchor B domain-containing protein